MQLYIIRHAQSENNALWHKTGSSVGRSDDPVLTDVGRRQADELAKFLNKKKDVFNSDKFDLQNARGFCLTHLYTSLMIRAVETGSVISEALNLPLIAWVELHEEGGVYLDNEMSGEKCGMPGKNRAYFQCAFPDLVLPDDLGDNGWWNCSPYETEEMSFNRARLLLMELVQRHAVSDDRVALITHGGFYNKLMAVLLNLNPTRDMWFSINNAAITRVDFNDGETAVVYTNRLDYLSRDLIS